MAIHTISKEKFIELSGLTMDDDIYVMSIKISDQYRFSILLSQDNAIKNITGYLARYMNYKLDKHGMLVSSSSNFKILIYNLIRMLQWDTDLAQWVNQHLQIL